MSVPDHPHLLDFRAHRQLRLLRLACAAMVLTPLVAGALVAGLPRPKPALAQGAALLWIFVLVTVLNLVTTMPTYRAMMAAPRRVYALSGDPRRLLTAHLRAHLLAFARLEGVALLGVVLFVLTGRADWFWVFAGVAVAGMLVLWPRAGRIERLLQPPAPVQGSGGQ